MGLFSVCSNDKEQLEQELIAEKSFADWTEETIEGASGDSKGEKSQQASEMVAHM